MTDRGIPQNAKKLEELLNAREQWKAEAQNFFLHVRSDTGMSQNAFARAINTSQSYVYEIEHGLKTPSSETLNKLRSIVEGDADGDQNEGEDQDERS